MPKKIDPSHKHEPPTPLKPVESGTTTELAVSYNDARCSNDDRITAIERHLTSLGQSVETLASRQAEAQPAISDEHANQRIDAMMRQVETLRAQVETIASQPSLTPDQVDGVSKGFEARAQRMIDKSLGAVTEEMTRMKVKMSSIERSSASALADDVEMISNIMSDTGKLVVSLHQRSGALEQEVSGFQSQLRDLKREFLDDLHGSLVSVANDLRGAA